MRREFTTRRESRGPCAAPGCDRGAIIATTLGRCCNRHYQAIRLHGVFEPPQISRSREVVCAQCGGAFDRGYAINATRAQRPQFCSPSCRALYQRKHSKQPDLPTHRPSGRRISQDGSGYILVRDPSHPLTCGGKLAVREHRIVMYDHYGAGTYACHWCGAVLEWATMHIDHINDDKADNRIENLAPACPRCNMARGIPKMAATHRANGRLLTYQGKTQCVSEWARELRIAPTALAWRLDRGWSIERALTAPRGKAGPQSRRHG